MFYNSKRQWMATNRNNKQPIRCAQTERPSASQNTACAIPNDSNRDVHEQITGIH